MERVTQQKLFSYWGQYVKSVNVYIFRMLRIAQRLSLRVSRFYAHDYNKLVNKNKCVVFMKGTPDSPQVITGVTIRPMLHRSYSQRLCMVCLSSLTIPFAYFCLHQAISHWAIISPYKWQSIRPPK